MYMLSVFCECEFILFDDGDFNLQARNRTDWVIDTNIIPYSVLNEINYVECIWLPFWKVINTQSDSCSLHNYLFIDTMELLSILFAHAQKPLTEHLVEKSPLCRM